MPSNSEEVHTKFPDLNTDNVLAELRKLGMQGILSHESVLMLLQVQTQNTELKTMLLERECFSLRSHVKPDSKVISLYPIN